MNPPYGISIKHWVEKAYTEAKDPHCFVVGLLPARTDTQYFHNFIYDKADIIFIRGRLKFGESKNSAPFPSMIVIWGELINKTYSLDRLKELINHVA